MIIINRPRGGGKTEALLDWAARGNWTDEGWWTHVVIVSSHVERERLVQLLAPRMLGVVRVELGDVTYAELRARATVLAGSAVQVATDMQRTLGLPREVELGIDNLNDVLTLLMRRPVTLATETDLEVRR